MAYVKLEDEKSLEEALKDVERTHMERRIKIVRAKPLAEKVQERKAKTSTSKDDEKPRVRKSSGSRRGGRGQGRGARKSSGSDNRKRVYRPRHNDDNSIYVGNLSFRTTEMRLGRHFEKWGEIKDVRIVEDEKERSRGFGYVEFEEKEMVEKALDADGTELDGRKVRVAKVQKKERKNRKSSEGETKKE